ncbi:unnamed protein product [Somion occarium]|uniref:F-box domain-containing protein n=1 Tax=Somion occarium TaxID=3059160 RepID=A0ABP1DIW4_9APHY
MANKRTKAVGSRSAKRIKVTANNVSKVKTNKDAQPLIQPRHLRGRRGSLRDMPAMPLDILFEVFVYLEPMDLLNLARTSKPFKQLLVDRTAARFWRAARENIKGLPDCPSFLSEPAYANLCFDAHCHNCLKPNIQTVHWEVKARYCQPCMNEVYYCFVSPESIDAYGDNPLPDPDNLLGWDVPYSIRRHKLSVKAIMEAWRQTPAENRAEFRIEYTARRKQLLAFASDYEKWFEMRKKARSKEIEETRQDRFNSVEQRLRDLGYGEDLDYACRLYRSGIHPLLKIPRVVQARPLTTRGWKNMEAEVLGVMDGIRATRLQKERLAAITRRIKKLGEALVPWRRTVGPITPYTQELLLMPEVSSLIDAPTTSEPTEEDFSTLEKGFYNFSSQWRNRGCSKLSQMVRSKIALPSDVDVFSLAVSQYFYCVRCAKVRYGYDSDAATYPNILVHRCLWESRSFPAPEDTYEGIIARLEVIEACDQDPARVTVDEMDALDIRLRCTGSCQEDGVYTVYTWCAAIEHTICGYECGTGQPSWEKVPLEYLADVATLEEIARLNREARRMDFIEHWFCSHCPRTFNFKWYSYAKRTRSSLVEHLRKEHDIDNPTELDMYYDPRQYDRVKPVYFIRKGLDLNPHRFLRAQTASRMGEVKWVDASWFDSLQA